MGAQGFLQIFVTRRSAPIADAAPAFRNRDRLELHQARAHELLDMNQAEPMPRLKCGLPQARITLASAAAPPATIAEDLPTAS